MKTTIFVDAFEAPFGYEFAEPEDVIVEEPKYIPYSIIEETYVADYDADGNLINVSYTTAGRPSKKTKSIIDKLKNRFNL